MIHQNKAKRLYFLDPIAALYMMKEFGIKITNFNNKETYTTPNLPSSELSPNMLAYLEFCIYKNSRIDIAKESESIFEPKEGDYGMWSKLERPMTFRQRSKWKEFNNGGYFSDTAEIIFRDNKHFFMPEVEDE